MFLLKLLAAAALEATPYRGYAFPVRGPKSCGFGYVCSAQFLAVAREERTQPALMGLPTPRTLMWHPRLRGAGSPRSVKTDHPRGL